MPKIYDAGRVAASAELIAAELRVQLAKAPSTPNLTIGELLLARLKAFNVLAAETIDGMASTTRDWAPATPRQNLEQRDAVDRSVAEGEPDDERA